MPMNEVFAGHYLQSLQAGEAKKAMMGRGSEFIPVKVYPELTDADVDLMNVVFRKLKALIPAWKNALYSQGIEHEAKREWFKAFVDAGVNSQHQLDAGFARLRSEPQTWWPTVAEFIGWCQVRASDGVPDCHTAYIEFCRKSSDLAGATFSHPIVRLAGSGAGLFEMRTLPEERAFPIFERSFMVLKRRLDAGEELGADIPKALPQESICPLSRDENKARMMELLRDVQ